LDELREKNSTSIPTTLRLKASTVDGVTMQDLSASDPESDQKEVFFPAIVKHLSLEEQSMAPCKYKYRILCELSGECHLQLKEIHFQTPIFLMQMTQPVNKILKEACWQHYSEKRSDFTWNPGREENKNLALVMQEALDNKATLNLFNFFYSFLQLESDFVWAYKGALRQSSVDSIVEHAVPGFIEIKLINSYHHLLSSLYYFCKGNEMKADQSYHLYWKTRDRKIKYEKGEPVFFKAYIQCIRKIFQSSWRV